MEIKRVSTSEIHWSIGWNAPQQAYSRLKEKIGDTSNYFAMLKVGNATYNWLVESVGQWRPMGLASDSDKVLILEKTEQIKQEVFAKLPDDDTLANKICQVPNYEEYIFYKTDANGQLDIIITGWGFHNFKKAGPFIDTWPPLPKMYSTTIAFIADGQRLPNRLFSIITPKMRKPDATDADGIRIFKEYPGKALTVIDEQTQRQFNFTTTDSDAMLEFDVTEDAPTSELPSTEEPLVEKPSAKPVPAMVTLTVLDEQGLPLRNAQFTLEQGTESISGTLDELGTTAFQKDIFKSDTPLTARIVTASQQQLEPVVFSLEDQENEYTLQEKSPKGGSHLLEVIAAILLLCALAALLIFAFQPGIEELTKWINKNIF